MTTATPLATAINSLSPLRACTRTLQGRQYALIASPKGHLDLYAFDSNDTPPTLLGPVKDRDALKALVVAHGALVDAAAARAAWLAARKPLTHHAVIHNFQAFLNGAKTHPITKSTAPELIAMLDCPHEIGTKFIVVSKSSKYPLHTTTVLDVNSRTLYRAAHEHGMAVFWRGVAARSGGAVQVLSPCESYDPAAKPKLTAREEWALLNIPASKTA